MRVMRTTAALAIACAVVAPRGVRAEDEAPADDGAPAPASEPTDTGEPLPALIPLKPLVRDPRAASPRAEPPRAPAQGSAPNRSDAPDGADAAADFIQWESLTVRVPSAPDPSAAAGAAEPDDSPWSRPARIGSAIGATAGLAAIGFGVGQGLASRRARQEFTDAATEVAAVAAKRRGEVVAERANGWLLGGGLLCLASVVTFALDEAEVFGPLDRAPQASLTILPTATGAIVGARVDFGR